MCKMFTFQYFVLYGGFRTYRFPQEVIRLKTRDNDSEWFRLKKISSRPTGMPTVGSQDPYYNCRLISAPYFPKYL